MKSKNFPLLLILIASFLLPYIICTALLFPEMTFLPIPKPTGMVKTLLVLVFFGAVIALLPVLPLVLLNLIPPLLIFVYFKIAVKGNEENMQYVFGAYHILLAVTFFYTWKVGKAMIKNN